MHVCNVQWRSAITNKPLEICRNDKKIRLILRNMYYANKTYRKMLSFYSINDLVYI
jgi:hypothetical protein